jgi:hypothetical protein
MLRWGGRDAANREESFHSRGNRPACPRSTRPGSAREYAHRALQLTANLRGEDVARGIQLYMAYAPEPPFNSGTPEGAPAAVLDKARASLVQLTKRREQTARKIAERLGVTATPLDPF